MRVFTSMHIQSFITKHYNTIQSSVAFITVVHYSEIVFKQAATEDEEKEKSIINQKKKKKKASKKLHVTVRDSEMRAGIFHESERRREIRR